MATRSTRSTPSPRRVPAPLRVRSALAPVLALLIGMAMVAGCGDSDAGIDLTDADSGTEITLDVGDQLTLRLESNPTTGYSWTIDEATIPDGIELVSSAYVADDTDDGVVGSGGTEVFVFEATAPGAGILRLTYLRPFEDDPVPARVVEYIVRIDDAPWPPATTLVPGTATAVAPTDSTDTTNSTAPTPSTTATQTPTTDDTASTTDPAAYESAVWPWLGADTGSAAQRFTDPVAAATSFAVDFVGFTDPVVGEFLQGDSRSGEVDVRARDDGPVTTVFVRRLGAEDSWWVLGSATGDVEIDRPTALETIDDQLVVTGRARTFEGNVTVQLRVDGDDEPILIDNVTGRGDGVFGEFDETFAVPASTADGGAALFIVRSAEDGSVWQVGVVRVLFDR